MENNSTTRPRHPTTTRLQFQTQELTTAPEPLYRKQTQARHTNASLKLQRPSQPNHSLNFESKSEKRPISLSFSLSPTTNLAKNNQSIIAMPIYLHIRPPHIPPTPELKRCHQHISISPQYHPKSESNCKKQKHPIQQTPLARPPTHPPLHHVPKNTCSNPRLYNCPGTKPTL